MSRVSQRRAWILDVGHGNSTVVEGPGHVSVIDGGRGDTLIRFLAGRNIRHVDTVLVSHVDADHFGGISLLLSDPNFQVGQVYVNPDVRETALWRDFICVMLDAKERGVSFNLELTDVNPGHVSSGGLRLEVLAPAQEIALKTSGGQTQEGHNITPNSMSAVVRVWADNCPRILIPGDIDQVGLNRLRERQTDTRAEVLVFPHHGGTPGNGDPKLFANSLLEGANPQLVVFSIGRGRYNLPRPDIVAAVGLKAKDVHIACTQLSQHCASDIPADGSSIHKAFGQGSKSGTSCGGTIEISLESKFAYSPSQSEHIEFVDLNAPTALCRGRNSTNLGPLPP